MNKNLNTYLDSYISFMQSKVTYFRSKKKRKKKTKVIKTQLIFRASDMSRARGSEQSWEHSIQKCLTA